MRSLVCSVMLVMAMAWSPFTSASAQVAFGGGTAGTGGVVPELTCNQAWMGHGQFALSIKNGVGGGVGFLAISLAQNATQVGGTTIYPNLGALILFLPVTLNGTPGVAGAGSAIVPLPLLGSPNPALAGARFYAQFVVIGDPSPGALAATRGLQIELTYPPAVFVGLSVGGSTDRHYFVDPITRTLLNSANAPETDNVTDARFAYGGTALFVGSSIRHQVNYADTTTIPPTWRTIYTSSGSGCYGIGFDDVNRVVWTLTDPGTTTRELTAIDADPASPNFGAQIANTVNAFGGTNFVERWSLAPSGKTACVLEGLFGTVTLKIIDTDPSSLTYLQVIQSSLVPLAPGLSLPTRAVYTQDESQILVPIQLSGQTPGELARFDVQNSSWIDHNASMAGQQNIGVNSQPAVTFGSAPTDIEVSPDGKFAIISGFGGTGWTGRLDLDPSNQASFSYTGFTLAAPLTGAWACGLAKDGLTMSVGSFPNAQLILVDPLAGAQLGTVALSGASNVYTILHR